VVNSKGRRRRPGTKSLAQVLRTDDHVFVDFIAKCLVWDPERRMKPQVALRHEFITSGRRPRLTSPSPSISKPLSLPSSSKQKGETPKKSQISAPAPLTARSSRTTVQTTPSTLSSLTLSTSRSHRTSQQQSYSGYYSARTINSLTVCGDWLFRRFKRSFYCRVLPRPLDNDHHFSHRSITLHVHSRITIMLSSDKYPTSGPWVIRCSHYSSTSPARSKDGSLRNTSLPTSPSFPT
jgi:serine/threonine protein kinase